MMVYSAGFKVSLEAGNFQPSGESFKEIYGGGFTMNLTAEVDILKNFEIYAGIMYFNASSKTEVTQENIELTLKDLQLGILYLIPISNSNIRIGGGADFCLHTETDPFGGTDDSKLGFFALLGYEFPLFEDKILAGIDIIYNSIKVQGVFEEVDFGGLRGLVGIKVTF